MPFRKIPAKAKGEKLQCTVEARLVVSFQYGTVGYEYVLLLRYVPFNKVGSGDAGEDPLLMK